VTVHTIPPGVPFARALAAQLWAQGRDAPEALARTTVLLPTRRACRGVQYMLEGLSAGRPCLLPTLVALGDIESSAAALAAAPPDLPPAMPATQRHLILLRLLLRAGHGPHTALPAARALARLLDEMAREEGRWDALDTLVPADLAEQWRISVTFLDILRAAWPAILAEAGAMDATARRAAVTDALAAAWAVRPPPGPVLAAGSTGSVPATARLLATIAGLPQGRVVLPGLDPDMDAADWDALEPTHPAWGLKQILGAMGVTRADVRPWPVPEPPPHAAARRRLLREVMRPAPGLAAWSALQAQDIAPGLAGVRIVTADTPMQEAASIALLLRGALEAPGRTAVLVTPDRALATRVVAALIRWGIAIDDSAGTPLCLTEPGVFLQAVQACVAQDRPQRAAVLALLRHPLCAVPEARQVADALEFSWRSGAEEGAGAPQVVVQACAPLCGTHQRTLADWVAAHVAAAEALSDPDRLWSGPAGQAAARLLADLVAQGDDGPQLARADYAAILTDMLRAETVRTPVAATHPRLQILGPLEARLLDADLMILAGLNEGTWPREAAPSPWLSRPMRAALGLPPAEQDVGLSAHDFVQAFAAPEVVLTRARRVDGVPTVPARWLERLEAMMEAVGSNVQTLEDGTVLYWAQELDRPRAIKPAKRPEPRPPLAQRPRSISVTQVEVWLRNPYALYARYVLRLRRLDPLEPATDARTYGQILHAIMERFVRGPTTPEAFRAAVRDVLPPGGPAFWPARLAALADKIVAMETAWRAQGAQPWALEATGRAEVIPGLSVYGRADRIDRLPGGGAAILDYKTGGKITRKALVAGTLPQLPIEALMLAAGGFTDIGAAQGEVLAYWILGKNPEVKRLDGPQAADVLEIVRAGLTRFAQRFTDEDTPYFARPRPIFAPPYDDYAQLARTDEWAKT
jgi:ATP-dependent helicase/nuclease subunit B